MFLLVSLRWMSYGFGCFSYYPLDGCLCILMIIAVSCITFPSISIFVLFSGTTFDTLRILLFLFHGVRLISHGRVPYS